MTALDPETGMFPETLRPAFVEAPELRRFALDLLDGPSWRDSFGEIRRQVGKRALSIAFVFETKPYDSQAEDFKPHTIAKVTKASPLWKALTGHDLVIQFRQTFWKAFTEAQREAVLFHEFCHIEVEDKHEGKLAITLAHHDVEEFVSVARRYGTTLPGRRQMAEAFAAWQRTQGGDNVVPLRAISAEDFDHQLSEAVMEAVALGALDLDGRKVTMHRDASRFGDLVRDDETLEQAYARLEQLDDFAELIGTDAGQHLLEELGRQRDLARRTGKADEA